jgi:hypothetical protein
MGLDGICLVLLLSYPPPRNVPASGGAANRCPITENRNCAQRSWIREPSPVVMPAPPLSAAWWAP